jgi:hypothetical protein
LSIRPAGIIAAVRGTVKLILAAAALVAAGALLAVLYSSSRSRANLLHCRNNLRHLGAIAARNWPGLEPSRTGREFWQGVREEQYRDVKGVWRMPPHDPFVCPVLGTTLSKPESASAIDYRGPRRVPEQLSELPKGEPLGADRPGNHPSGGHVLWLDLSVEEQPERVERVGPSEPRWEHAGRALSD